MLVIGGGGVFGARLVEAILASTEWQVTVASRRGAAARPGVSAVVLDARTCAAADILATGCDAVVDMAGPFQGAGTSLALAAIEAGVPYLDIADGRDFVAGFGPALDQAARAAGSVALTGASSTPALSNAALDAITAGWTRVDTVRVAISPGNRAPRGRSVVAAVLSYAGQGLRVLIDGRWARRPGWGMTRRLAMPGLGPRLTSLCDTPDLDIVPARFGVRATVLFLAGLELPLLHLGLAAASLLVRARLLRSLAPFASVARGAAMLASPFGTDRGGMLVEASGRDGAGRDVRARWSLVAEGGDGPSIPVLPALAMLRRLARGDVPEPGARPCVGMLDLADIEAEMRRYRTVTATFLEQLPAALFRRALGAPFGALPAPIQALHEPGAWAGFAGMAEITAAETWPARAVAALFGFPRRSGAVPVRVVITAEDGIETWRREFGGHRFRSRLRHTRRQGEIEERFGPFAFRLALAADATGLRMAVAAWRIGRLPLPLALAPVSSARESVDARGRFRFDVPIGLPLGLGRVVRYVGWLEPLAAPILVDEATRRDPVRWPTGW